jgi:hypothetical protein
MHVQRHAPPVEIRRPEAEAITDPFTDFDAADRRAAGQGRLIARGSARGRVHG